MINKVRNYFKREKRPFFSVGLRTIIGVTLLAATLTTGMGNETSERAVSMISKNEVKRLAIETKFNIEEQSIINHWGSSVKRYEKAFNYSRNDRVFFDPRTNEVILVTPKKGIRAFKHTRDSLEQAIGVKPWNTTGSEEAITKGREQGAPFLNIISDVYESYGLPRDLVSHQIVESALRPRVQSFYHRRVIAEGICQIHHTINDRIRSFARRAPNGFVYSEFDPITQSQFCAAIIEALAKKDDSYMIALSEFQSGQGNMSKVLANGEHIATKTNAVVSPLEQYMLGAEFTAEHHFRHVSFRNASLAYTQQVVSQISRLHSLMMEVPQDSVYRYQVAKQTTLTALARQTQLPLTTLQFYNPQVNRRGIIPKKGFVYLPYEQDSVGTLRNDWETQSPELEAVINDWDAFNPVVWDETVNPVLESFSDRFLAAGDPYRAYAMLYVRVASKKNLLEHERDPKRNHLLNEYINYITKQDSISQNLLRINFQ